MSITAAEFASATGGEPKDDDLERSNCPEAGSLGHLCCGWCDDCNLPVFICAHFKATP